MSSTVDAYGRCQCAGWGVFGERPNVRYCDCPIGQSLQHDIEKWRRPVFDKIKPDGRGKVYRGEYWTTKEWLEFLNSMPQKLPGRVHTWDPPGNAIFPAGRMITTADVNRAEEERLKRNPVQPIREPGDESEYET